MNPKSITQWSRRVKMVVGVASALLGLLVIVGWHAGNVQLLRVSPSFAIMPYNLALAFLLGGVGLILFSLGRRGYGTLLGSVVLGIGLVTLLEHLLSFDTGIDQCLIGDYVTPASLHPGRMSAVSAMCLVLLGVMWIMIGVPNGFRYRFLFLGVLGAAVAVVGAMSLHGYLMGPIGGHENGFLGDMAFHAAIGFVLLGIGTVIIGWSETRQAGEDVSGWLPLLVGSAAITAVLCVWRLLNIQQELHIEQTIQVEASRVNDQIRSQMEAQIRPLIRMGERWKVSAGPREGEWKLEANLYLNDFWSCEMLEWVSPSFDSQWLASGGAGRGMPKAAAIPEAARKAVLEAAAQARRPTVSRVVQLGEGRRMVLVCVPMFENAACKGFLVAGFHSRHLFDSLLENVAPGYSVAVFDGEVELYGRYDATRETETRWGQQREIKVWGVPWRVSVWPTIFTLRGMESIIPRVTLGVGLVIALLIMLSLHLAQLARKEERELIVLNRQLEGEIRDRKEAEEHLRTREERYRLLVNGVRDYAIFMLDPKGRVMSWNPGAERLMGYKEEEVTGKNISMFHPSDCGTDIPAGLLRRAAETGACEDEGLRIRKDGSQFWCHVRITALHDDEGRLRGFANITHDITERKHAEVELIRSNTELEQFAYVASHDLQEPLRMVRSFAQLIAQRYKDRIDSDANVFISHLVDGAARMQTLIHDLLDYSRVGRGKVRMEEVNCEKLLDLSLTNLQAAIAESRATVTRDRLPVVRADSTQLVRLFQNLIGNAIKFHGEDPLKIHVSAAKSNGSEWLFSIRDNGIGIDPQFDKRIFVIFQRLHGREDYPGTGIGLAVCKKIVESYGGRIWVESARGKGSTFYFTFPDHESPNDQHA